MTEEVHFTADLSQMLDRLHALSDPGLRTIAHLETVLHEAFVTTQAETHVITGSLKGSGRTSSDYHGGVWEGEIRYGGPSPGFPNDPVTYAFYERRRGDTHDFLRSAPVFRHSFEQTVLRHLAGDE